MDKKILYVATVDGKKEYTITVDADTYYYLKWFAQEADFGPGHSDVMIEMQERYEKDTGQKVPEDWRY